MKKYLLMVAIAILCMACNSEKKSISDEPMVGDIVFHTEGNPYKEVVAYATGNEFTHCGIIVRHKGSLHVLEMQQTSTLTPLNDFLNRRMEFGASFCIKRSNVQVDSLNYKKYLRHDYDYNMLPNNGRYYGAELVYEIYKNELGIELCQPRAAKEFNTDSIMGFISNRNIKPNQLIISPADLYNSPALQVAKESRHK